MSAGLGTLTKALGFLVGIAAVFGLALGLGRVVGPVGEPAAAPHGEAAGESHGAEAPSGTASSGSETAAPADLPGGLLVSQDGYTLRLATPTVSPGADVAVTFRVTGPNGVAVTAFDVAHEQRLHLIAVRRDLTGYQHVHPTMATDGTWTARLDLEPGVWRLFADFIPTGARPVTLGTDLTVRGTAALAEPVPPTRTVHVDGYTVTVTGNLVAGQDARLTLSVSKAGQPVTDLEPYLGAYGHLVALREGDLAYLHVHPDGEPGDGRTKAGPDVVFHAAVPSPGTYRLYLDFKHDGMVHTAPLVVTSGTGGPGTSPATPDPSTSSGHSGDGH